MINFDDREKSFENKFAHEEEIKFKITSRKRKMLGLWAAELIGLSEEESLNYARDIIIFGIENSAPDAIIKKIVNDAQKNGVKLLESQIRAKSSEFEVIATKQFKTGKK